MIDILINRIKTNIAQHTNLFDIETTTDVAATTKNNIITIPGLEGEYTLSGAEDFDASKGCINDTLIFAGGQATTQCYFGEDDVVHTLVTHKVNVGKAFRRDIALEMIADEKKNNAIIPYIGSAKNISGREKNSISEDLTLKVAYNIGVLFKVEAEQIDSLGCISYDALFINSVIGAKKQGSTMVEFKSIIDRFLSGKYYVIDIEFGYTDNMFMIEEFKNGLKNFESNGSNFIT